jgi:hypothetical protein
MDLDDLLIAARRMDAAGAPAFSKEEHVMSRFTLPPDDIVAVEASARRPQLCECLCFSGFETNELVEPVQGKITHGKIA